MNERGAGRPRVFDYDQALVALVMLFWEKGFEATTQQDMLARTGLSSSSLLNAFGSKSQIFDAVLNRYQKMQIEGLTPLRQGEGGLDDLMNFIDQMELHVTGKKGCPRGCLAVKTMTGPSSSRAGIAEQLENYRRNLNMALEGSLSRAAGLGEIERLGLGGRVRILSATLIGILLLESWRK